MITHRNVANVVIHTNERFQVGSQDRILALSALNHDLSVYDIFGLLSAGGTIVMPDAAAVKDPSHWVELMVRERVTLWNSVPAMMEMVVDYAEGQSVALPDSLRLAILGGDWLPVSLPDRIRALVPRIELLSIGGPTETTIWNIGYLIEKVDPNWKSIPYGQPMANSKYYILNDALEDCPVWVPGQMYCSGVQLAKGYWRNPEKTEDSFCSHPRTGERLYRTGDLGCYRPDGNIEFLGRVDFQIKIRGHRIEAGEIEAALTQHPAVKAAVVSAIQERLLAYIVANKKAAPTVEELRNVLSRKLPDYMIPSAFIVLEKLPLSANGKVDRRALPNPEGFIQELEVDYVPPQNDIEQTIAIVWQTVLNLEKVGVNSNFFEIGGNSLLITTIYNKLRKSLPNEVDSISLVDLFKYPTIRSLAKYLSQAQQAVLPERKDLEVVKRLAAGKTRIKQRFKKSQATKL
jgi:acyl-coenzyme A synthetase/AMP-(fatty) acid ligase